MSGAASEGVPQVDPSGLVPDRVVAVPAGRQVLEHTHLSLTHSRLEAVLRRLVLF